MAQLHDNTEALAVLETSTPDVIANIGAATAGPMEEHRVRCSVSDSFTVAGRRVRGAPCFRIQVID